MKLTIPYPQPLSSTLYLHTLCLLLIFMTACSVFKEKSFFQADSLQKQDTRRETNTKESMQAEAVRVYHHQDSSDNQSFTEIFPDGLFKYSIHDGFIGIAKRVVLNGRLKAGTKISDSVKVNHRNNTVSSSRENERLLTQTRLKEKTLSTRNDTLWYLGGLLLVFAAVFAFRWKLND